MDLIRAYEMMEDSFATNKPLLVSGPPGVGKSALAKQFARAKFQPRDKQGKFLPGDAWKKHFIDWRLSELESVDMRGTPRERNGFTYWAPPIEFPCIGNDSTPDEGILFLDELLQTKGDVQKVAARLVQERRIGEAYLKPGWKILAATNRMIDASGVTPMLKNFGNRFWHCDIEVSLEAWIKNFAEPNEIDERVVAYLKYAPSHLLNFDPRSKEHAFASPRTWEAVSDMLKHLGNRVDSMDDVLLGEYCGGHVGSAIGKEFAGFLRTLSSLVSIEQILLDPDGATIPNSPSVCYALATALATHVKRNTIEAAFKYLGRMSKEFQALFAYKIKQRQPGLQNTKAFVTWAALNADYL